jgi:hypothetical protein
MDTYKRLMSQLREEESDLLRDPISDAEMGHLLAIVPVEDFRTMMRLTVQLKYYRNLAALRFVEDI